MLRSWHRFYVTPHGFHFLFPLQLPTFSSHLHFHFALFPTLFSRPICLPCVILLLLVFKLHCSTFFSTCQSTVFRYCFFLNKSSKPRHLKQQVACHCLPKWLMWTFSDLIALSAAWHLWFLEFLRNPSFVLGSRSVLLKGRLMLLYLFRTVIASKSSTDTSFKYLGLLLVFVHFVFSWTGHREDLGRNYVKKERYDM